MNISLRMQILKAINLLDKLDSNLTDDGFIEKFISNGIDEKLAFDLYVFIPIAFCRAILPDFNFPETYIDMQGEFQTESRYDSNNLFKEVSAEVKKVLNEGFEKGSILKIAGRSAEFKAINDMLLNDVELEDIVLTPSIILRK